MLVLVSNNLFIISNTESWITESWIVFMKLAVYFDLLKTNFRMRIKRTDKDVENQQIHFRELKFRIRSFRIECLIWWTRLLRFFFHFRCWHFKTYKYFDNTKSLCICKKTSLVNTTNRQATNLQTVSNSEHTCYLICTEQAWHCDSISIISFKQSAF